MAEYEEGARPDSLPFEVVRKIVKSELQPFCLQQDTRLANIETNHEDLREQFKTISSASSDHSNRLMRIESKMETVVGSADVEGQLPKMERKMESEWAKASTFRHTSLNAHQNVLDAIAMLRIENARIKGVNDGTEQTKGKVAEWVKWVAGGVSAYMLGRATGPAAAIWEAVRHFSWGR